MLSHDGSIIKISSPILGHMKKIENFLYKEGKISLLGIKHDFYLKNKLIHIVRHIPFILCCNASIPTLNAIN